MTAKQKLASQHNWHKAQIMGNIASLVRICYDLGLPEMATAFKKTQDSMVKTNEDVFRSRRAKL